MHDIHALLRSARFQDGLVVGLVAAALVVCSSMVRTQRRPSQLGGLAFVVAVVVAQAIAQGLSGDHNAVAWLTFATGLALLGVAGRITTGTRRPSGSASPRRCSELVVALVIGAVGAVSVTAYVGHPQAQWLRPLAILAIIVLAPLIADFDARFGEQGATQVLVLVSTGAIYLAVPDTERALVLVGVATPLALLAVLDPRARLGRAGAFAIAGSLVWAVTYGAAGRPVTMIGGLGCLGLLATAPTACLLTSRPRPRATSSRFAILALMAVLQCLLAVYAAEVVGRAHTLGAAFALLLPAAIVGVLAGRLLAPFAGGAASAAGASSNNPL